MNPSKEKAILFRIAHILTITLCFAFSSVRGLAKNGVYYTAEELAVWQERAANGPFKSAGDAFENSPGDWDRMIEDAEIFLNEDRFNMVWEGPKGSVDENSELHKNYMKLSRPVVRMMTAAFVDLVQGTDYYKRYIKQILIEQAQRPGVDFSNREIYQGGSFVGNNDIIWIYAEWQMKFLRAYDYLGQDYFTPSEQQILIKWFKDGAEWHMISVQKALSELYNTKRGSVPIENYELSSLIGPGELTHRGGYTTYKSGRYYNNRRLCQVSFLAYVGVLLNNEPMKKEASDTFKEWLAFWWFPDGYFMELHRSSPGRPQAGLGYGPNTITLMAEVARVLYQNRYENLFEFCTSLYIDDQDGSITNGDVEKNLEWAVLQLRRKFMEKDSSRIYPAKSSGSSPDILMHYCQSTNEQITGHRVKPCESSAIVNFYYKNPEISEIYWPTDKLCGFPSKPTTQGVFCTWNGTGGTLPGYMFQFAGIDIGKNKK